MEFSIKELASQIKVVVKEEKKTRDLVTHGSKYKLKRSPFQSLDEKGMLEPNFIVKEFGLIQQKKSSLSAGERSVINQIVFMAMQLAAEKKMQKKETSEKEKGKIVKQKKSRSIKKSKTKTKDDGRE